MTPKQMDKIILTRKPVVVSDQYGNCAILTFISRDRRIAYTRDGGAFEFRDLKLVED